MERLKPPKPLNLDEFLLQNWKSWKQDFTLFRTDTKYDEKPDNVKVVYCYTVLANEQGKYMTHSAFLPQLTQSN